MTIATGKLTAAEFLELPEVQAGARWELVKGEVVVSPRPNFLHSHVSSMLNFILVGHCRERDLGVIFPEVDTIMEEDEVRTPDILYYSKARAPARGTKNSDIIPDLCIEILSPSHARRDRVDKFKPYQDRGVAHYWIVDPVERTIEAYSLDNDRYVTVARGGDNDVLRLPPFPDLLMNLEMLWW